jgi:hypothetical protein
MRIKQLYFQKSSFYTKIWLQLHPSQNRPDVNNIELKQNLDFTIDQYRLLFKTPLRNVKNTVTSKRPNENTGIKNIVP